VRWKVIAFKKKLNWLEMCGIELHDRKVQRNVNGQGIEKCKENIK